MTNDEAVRCNKQLWLFMAAEDAANDTNRFLEESYTALDMAIEALELKKRLLERKSYLYYKDNPTEVEKAEYYALERLLEVQNDE